MLLPLLLIPLAECWERGGLTRVAALGLTGVGAILLLPGALTDFIAAARGYDSYIAAVCPTDFCRSLGSQWWHHYIFISSELAYVAWWLFTGHPDLAWVTFSGTWLVPVTFILVAGFGAAGYATAGGYTEHRP